MKLYEVSKKAPLTHIYTTPGLVVSPTTKKSVESEFIIDLGSPVSRINRKTAEALGYVKEGVQTEALDDANLVVGTIITPMDIYLYSGPGDELIGFRVLMSVEDRPTIIGFDIIQYFDVSIIDKKLKFQLNPDAILKLNRLD